MLSRRTLLRAGTVCGALLLARPLRVLAATSTGAWARGDAHVHTDHSSDGSLPRQVGNRGGPGDTSVGSQSALGAAIGLAWMSLTDHRTYTQHWDPQWTSGQLLLIPGEEANSAPHATVLGHVDTLVDGANPEGSAAYRHLQQSVWDVHAQDAVWGTAHPQDGEYDDGVVNDNASTVGVDTVEGGNRVVDPDPDIDYAENRWNAGFRFGLTTSSDSHFTEIAAIQGPGTSQTLVFRRDGSERATLDALRAGRTTTANGPAAPVLTLEGDVGDGFSALAGDEVRVRPGKTVRLRVRVQHGVGTTVLVYAAPGRSAGPLATYRPATPDETYLLDATVRDAHTWWRAEARGPSLNAGLPTDPDGPVSVQAATSALFADSGGPAEPRAEIPLPAEQRRPDGAERLLGDQGRFAGFADVARGDDAVHVVAERHDEGATRVVYRRGSDTREVDLAPDSRTARFPRVAALGPDVWVVWQDERAGQQPRRPDIYLRYSTDGGRSWLPEQRLTGGDARHERPAIALAGAVPVVAWQSNAAELSGGAFEVLVQAIGQDAAPTAVSLPGKVTSPGNPVDSRSPRFPASLFPALAVTPDGAVAVVWQDNRTDPDPLFTGRMSLTEGEAPDGTDPDDWEVLAAVRAPGGTWSAPRTVSADPAAADEHPSVVCDPAGVLHVGWDARPLENAGVNPAVRAAWSSDLGATWSASVPVGLAPEAMSQRPRLGLDPDGTVRAVWYDARSTDWRWNVATATLSGDRWSQARLVTSAGNSTWPALSGGQVVFTSDRAARRVQRDPTQQIFGLELAARTARTDRAQDPTPGAATPGAAMPGAAMPGAATPGGAQPPALPSTGGPGARAGLAALGALAAAAFARRRRGPGEDT